MTIEGRAVAVVAQPPGVVHARLVELAERVRSEPPHVPAGSQAAQLLGLDGPVGLRIHDRGPDRIELETLDGRVRGALAALLAPTPDGTSLTLEIALRPEGFMGSMALGMAERMVPNLRTRFDEGVSRALEDLARELAVPDAEWDVERLVSRMPTLD